VDVVLNVVGASASVVGLVASVVALCAARSAKQVAAEVRAEMRRRSAREEADALLADAREMSALVTAQQWFAVQRSAERLLAHMNVLRREHLRRFDTAALRDVDVVAERLRDFGSPPDAVASGIDARRATDAAIEIVCRWAGVVGHLRRLDQGVD